MKALQTTVSPFTPLSIPDMHHQIAHRCGPSAIYAGHSPHNLRHFPPPHDHGRLRPLRLNQANGRLTLRRDRRSPAGSECSEESNCSCLSVSPPWSTGQSPPERCHLCLYW